MSAPKFYASAILLVILSLISLGQGLTNNGITQFEKGQIHHKNGIYDSARHYFESATSNLDKDSNLETWVKAMSWLGWSYMDLARNSEADSVLNIAIKEAKGAWGEKHPEVAFAYHILSRTYASRGCHKQSNEYVRISLDLRTSLYDSIHDSMGAHYAMLGFNYRSLSPSHSAPSAYTFALA